MATKTSPAQLEKKLQTLERELASLLQRLALLRTQVIEQKTEREMDDLWKKTARALKGKLPKDPVAWQRKIRSEWDRPRS